MGLIFNDERDEQQQAMMQTTAIGLTWQYCTVTALVSFTAAAFVDYTMVRTTDYSGVLDWFLTKITE